MSPQEPIAIDTETGLIRPGLLAPPLVCVSVAHESGVELVHQSESREWITAMLESDRLLVGHNIAYDFGVIAARFPELLPLIFAKYERGEITDTEIREKLLHIAMGCYRKYERTDGRWVHLSYSLAACAERHLSIVLEKDGLSSWRLRYQELIDVPIVWWPQEAVSYALDDATATRGVYLSQREGDDHGWLEDEHRQARAAWWLHLMSCWGLRTDAAGVRAFAQEIQADHDRVAADLIAAGLMRKTGSRDTKAAASRMRSVCAVKGIAVVLTPTGKPKLDADCCESTGDPILEGYARISSLKKQLSTDVPLLEQGTSTAIQPRFEVLLETGRTSSSPNVQNLPRKGGMRECFVPREGNVFAAADYAQFELRTVAQVCLNVFKSSRLADALNAGFDPHLEIARRILGITYEDALKAKHEPDVDNARQVGKVGNFGFPGGLGIARFVTFARKQYGVEITEQEAAALKDYWLQAWPEFRDYFKWVGDQCDERVPRIKHHFSNRFRGNVSFCEACNSFFQGLAADAAKAAGFLIARACYVEPGSPLFGCRPVNFVHDEFILEAPEHRAADAAVELARLMVLGASPFLPDVPPLAEPYLMRRWSKKAGPIFKDGRLIPWAA